MVCISALQLLSCTVGQSAKGISVSQLESFIKILEGTFSSFNSNSKDINIFPLYPTCDVQYGTDSWQRYYVFNEKDNNYYKRYPLPIDFFIRRDIEMYNLESEILQKIKPSFNVLTLAILMWKST